jgi:hypothetical protein
LACRANQRLMWQPWQPWQPQGTSTLCFVFLLMPKLLAAPGRSEKMDCVSLCLCLACIFSDVCQIC